jgi:hypothetical protein
MSAFYDRLAASALRVITAKGQELELRRYGGVFDPVAGEVVVPGYDTGLLQCVVFPASEAPRGFSDSLSEKLESSKARFILAAVDPASVLTYPEVGDVVFLSDDYWRIVGLSTLAPGGTSLVHSILVKREALTSEFLDAIDTTELEVAVANVDAFVDTT